MDLAEWLRSLGLERYEGAFRENEISEKVLPSLTAEDLKEIGVGPVGHRRILLEAIAALRTDTGGKVPSTEAASTASAPTVAPEDRAERRQVTVMFSDLVGSTALSVRMDPEDLREVISAYHECVAETVRRFGGFVAKYMGDGVLVYFGYPQAHEDDAERATRAGLELTAAVANLQARAPLQTRVGIATGLVVVGDAIGSGEAQERGIVGETPNLAARLQSIAEPNTVFVADGTRRLLGGLFELEDRGTRDLKGIARSVRVWAALRPAAVESRFEALHASITALVGREEKVEILLRRWSRAKSGDGQVVLLSGEAGIGKSRLTAALMERLAGEPHTRLRYFCSPQHTDSAFYPIIGQLERAAEIRHDDTAPAKLDKLDAILARTSASKHDAALFAELLSLANDGRYPTVALDAQQRRQRTLEAFTTQLERLSNTDPVLMIFEDAHWSDPTSIEAFGRAVDQTASLRALLIVTYRPEFAPPWIGRPHVTALIINRLAQRDIEAMIDRVAGNKALSAKIRQDIIERSDGVPLFVEEMTKAVLEAGNEIAAERTVAALPSPAAVVPASLHASLMARLDRLGPAKEVAQIGAAIGREFSHTLLAVVIRRREADLNAALDRLIDAGLLFRQGSPPHANYVFKHALVQDTAYGTLLREQRRALHARVAETLESQFAEIAESQPELLARHCTAAGQVEKAACLWGKAGQRSLERSALLEAAEQLSRALEQIGALPSAPSLRREEIKLQVALANTLMHVKGYAAPESKAAEERARTLIAQAEGLGEAPEDPLLLYSVLYGIWAANYVGFNGTALREFAAQFLALAEKDQATVPLMVGHRIMGYTSTVTGRPAQARMHFDEALPLYDPTKHRPLANRFSVDVGISILTYRSIALWLLGYPAAAQADTERALAEAQSAGHAAALMYALIHAALIHMLCGDYATAKVEAAEGFALAEGKGASFWIAMGALIKGCLSAVEGEAANGVERITSGLASLRSTGATCWATTHLSYLTLAYLQLGRFDDARRGIADAIEAVETNRETWWEAEVYRIAGDVTLRSPDSDAAKARALFERSLTAARDQQAKSWELRAAMSMARLWRDQGKPQQARELLAPVYGWFTEGFDTRDLKEAKALLDELS